VGGNGIVFIQDHLFLIFICRDDLKVIWPKSVGVYFLDTVNEFDRGCVAVFGKEGNRSFSSLDCFQDAADRFVNKKSILNLVLMFFGRLFIQPFRDLGVVWHVRPLLVLFSVTFIFLALAFLILLVVATDL
jgi:hypothetical protein